MLLTHPKASAISSQKGQTGPQRSATASRKIDCACSALHLPPPFSMSLAHLELLWTRMGAPSRHCSRSASVLQALRGSGLRLSLEQRTLTCGEENVWEHAAGA